MSSILDRHRILFILQTTPAAHLRSNYPHDNPIQPQNSVGQDPICEKRKTNDGRFVKATSKKEWVLRSSWFEIDNKGCSRHSVVVLKLLNHGHYLSGGQIWWLWIFCSLLPFPSFIVSVDAGLMVNELHPNKQSWTNINTPRDITLSTFPIFLLPSPSVASSTSKLLANLAHRFRST